MWWVASELTMTLATASEGIGDWPGSMLARAKLLTSVSAMLEDKLKYDTHLKIKIIPVVICTLHQLSGVSFVFKTLVVCDGDVPNNKHQWGPFSKHTNLLPRPRTTRLPSHWCRLGVNGSFLACIEVCLGATGPTFSLSHFSLDEGVATGRHTKFNSEKNK